MCSGLVDKSTTHNSMALSFNGQVKVNACMCVYEFSCLFWIEYYSKGLSQLLAGIKDLNMHLASAHLYTVPFA